MRIPYKLIYFLIYRNFGLKLLKQRDYYYSRHRAYYQKQNKRTARVYPENLESTDKRRTQGRIFTVIRTSRRQHISRSYHHKHECNQEKRQIYDYKIKHSEALEAADKRAGKFAQEKSEQDKRNAD